MLPVFPRQKIVAAHQRLQTFVELAQCFGSLAVAKAQRGDRLHRGEGVFHPVREFVNKDFAALFGSGARFLAHRVLVHQPVEGLAEDADFVTPSDNAGACRIVTAPPGFRGCDHAHQRPADDAFAHKPGEKKCDGASQREQRDAVAHRAVDGCERFAARDAAADVKPEWSYGGGDVADDALNSIEACNLLGARLGFADPAETVLEFPPDKFLPVRLARHNNSVAVCDQDGPAILHATLLQLLSEPLHVKTGDNGAFNLAFADDRRRHRDDVAIRNLAGRKGSDREFPVIDRFAKVIAGRKIGGRQTWFAEAADIAVQTDHQERRQRNDIGTHPDDIVGACGAVEAADFIGLGDSAHRALDAVKNLIDFGNHHMRIAQRLCAGFSVTGVAQIECTIAHRGKAGQGRNKGKRQQPVGKRQAAYGIAKRQTVCFPTG